METELVVEKLCVEVDEKIFQHRILCAHEASRIDDELNLVLGVAGRGEEDFAGSAIVPADNVGACPRVTTIVVGVGLQHLIARHLHPEGKGTVFVRDVPNQVAFC